MNLMKCLNLTDYPLDQPGSKTWQELVESSKQSLKASGLFNLPGFITEDALGTIMTELGDQFETSAFTHHREHNIYFKKEVEGLEADHPALRESVTTNHTLCADQIAESLLTKIYEWPEFALFLAAVMNKSKIYTMDDPIARLNVLAYRQGEALNWHFDRSEFTTTLLLQDAIAGGVFEYCKDLRSEDNPNYEGVARLIDGVEPTTLMPQTAGTLNVFRGKNTAHRVSPVEGDKERIVAVLSYYDQPGVSFSAEEQLGFYGRQAKSL